MVKLTKSPLYRGLTRIFIVIAVVWTGLILFWVRDENFDVVRPDEKMSGRVINWHLDIDQLCGSSNLPEDRRRLIQKALNTRAYLINGSERKLTAAELKGCRTILENGFSPQVKAAIVLASESAKDWSSGSMNDRYRTFLNRTDTPAWDFRGVGGIDLGNLARAVGDAVFWLNEIQTFPGGMDRRYAYGMLNKFTPSGEFTGLVTEEDFALQADLWKAQHDRRFLKPLFWVAAWLVPLLGMAVAGVAGVELVRWITRGFRQTGSARTC